MYVIKSCQTEIWQLVSKVQQRNKGYHPGVSRNINVHNTHTIQG